MAGKTLGTRQKLVFRGPAPAALRNPFAAAALKRKAGAHDKGPGAKRQLEKRLLAKRLEKLAGGDPEA